MKTLRPSFAITVLLCLLASAAHAIEVKVAFTTKTLKPNQLYKNLATITVITPGVNGAADVPVANKNLAVRVISSDALIVDGGSNKASTTLTTGADGKVNVTLLTQSQPSATLDIVPLDEANNNAPMDDLRRQFVLDKETLEFESSLFSRRVFTEVFLGSTFTNDYDKDTKKSLGFSEAAPVARVTFDTIWPGKGRDGQANIFTGSLIHSGINMQFASFPFGEGQGEDPKSQKGFDEAFTGSLYLMWQPEHWLFRSYTETSTRPGVRFDAMRIGVVGLAGMTTRATAGDDGDTTIRRTQLGFKFTHHQTDKGTPHMDQDNTVPIRFLEITWGHFEQYGTTLEGTPRKGANRLMIDAGVRLPGMGGNLIPFYAGIHFNGGPGTDDLRVFAGFLFKVNEIAKAFQRSNAANQP